MVVDTRNGKEYTLNVENTIDLIYDMNCQEIVVYIVQNKDFEMYATKMGEGLKDAIMKKVLTASVEELSALGLSVGKSIYDWAKGDKEAETEPAKESDHSVEKETQGVSDPPVSSPGSSVTQYDKPKPVYDPPVSSLSAERRTKIASTDLGKLKDIKTTLLNSKIQPTGRGGLDVAKAAIVRSGIADLEFVDQEDEIEEYVGDLLDKMQYLDENVEGLDELYLCGDLENCVARSGNENKGGHSGLGGGRVWSAVWLDSIGTFSIPVSY